MEDEGGVPHGWWGETVATLKLALAQEALTPKALEVVAAYVSLLDVRNTGVSNLLLARSTQRADRPRATGRPALPCR